MTEEKKYKYYIIEMIDPPYKNLDKYICIPNSWIRFQEIPTDDTAVIKFPIEKLSETKKRVKKRDNYSESWPIFVAYLKYGTDSYADAKEYIKVLNNILIQEKSYDQIVNEDTGPLTSGKKISKSRSSSETFIILSDTNPSVSKTESKQTQADPNVKVANSATTQKYVTRQAIKKSLSSNKLSLATSINSRDQNTSMPEKSNEQSKNDIEQRTNFNGSGKNESSVNHTLELASTSSESQISKPIFGEEFSDLLNKLHCDFTDSYKLFDDMRNVYYENCLTMKNVVELVDKFNKSNAYNSDDAATKNVTGMEVEKKQDKTNKIEEMRKMINDKIQLETESQTICQKMEENKNDNNDCSKEKMDADNNSKKDEEKNEMPSNKIRGHARKFTLPKEYDENDSKWTLRYRKKKKGLVELSPHSGVYVDAIRLSNCKRLSKDSKTLARMLLMEIFTESALSTCSLTGRRANAFDLDATSVRPGLDEHARNVLLNFVEEYTQKQKWVKLDTQSILNSIRNKIQEMRSKFG